MSGRFYRHLLALGAVGLLLIGVAPTVVAVGLAPPSPYAPGDLSEAGPVVSTEHVELRWNPVSGATNYEVAISVFPYGSSYIVYNEGQIYGTSVEVPSGVLSAGQKYRWNLQARDDAGNYSGWSSRLYFQTSPEQVPYPPTAYTPGSPSEFNAPFLGGTQMLAWSEVGGATGYNLIISQRGNGGYGAEGPENLVLTRTGLTSTSYPVNLDELPDDATQFQWRVQAVNSVGTSPQSSPSYFQTLAGIADVGAASTPNVASGAVIAVSPETNRTENSTTPRNIIIPPKGLIPAHLADDDSQSIELPAVDDGSAKLVDDNNQLNNQLAPDTSGRYYPPQALDKFYKYLGVFAAIITIITAPTIFKSRKPKTITNIYNFKTLNFGESPASDNKIEGESSDVIHEDNLGDLDTHGYA